jgi:D-threonate/D-erythronate kinase
VHLDMVVTVLADDLTGACDTGCLFAGRGAVGVIAEPALRDSDASLVAVDTESRDLEPAEAGRHLRVTAERLSSRLGGKRTFKKIDSTMRGPVGAELDGLLESGGWDGALVCPAFPAQGRVVRDGLLRVDGALAHESAVGRDRHYPGSTSDVAAMLEPALKRPVTRLLLPAVRAGAETVLERLAQSAGGVIAADAESDADLATLARAAARRSTLLLAGSAGLGRAFAAALGYPPAQVPLPPAGAWLWVVGSRHPASRAQVLALEAAGVPGAWLDGNDRPDLGGVVRALRRGGPAFIMCAPAAALEPRAAAAALGAAVAHVLEEAAVGVLAVAGGETAFGLIGVLRAARLDLVGAPASGLALGTLTLGDAAPARARPLPFVTKAGGFGAPDLFLTLLGGPRS